MDNKLLAKQYKSGSSLRKLASEHNISIEWVRQLVIREGVPMRSRSENKRPVDSSSKNV